MRPAHYLVRARTGGVCVHAHGGVRACTLLSFRSPTLLWERNFERPLIVALDLDDPGIGEPAQSAVLSEPVDSQLS